MTHTLPVQTLGAGDAGEIAAEKLVSGEAATQLWHAFSDKTGRFHVGHWGSGPCEINVSYTEDELCVIVEGSVTLISEDGTEATYETGQAFVIPSGFKGIWRSNEPVKKIYASYE